ncbi:vacuolar-type H+-ATPase subunit I/STV1 [Salinibacterium sp. CAN_S4]|uniref:hypothetical protein n=1 Tax=Salinibacterium sp. CAN_S4 TaxID=2787727 RepID=UPI0018EF7954
MTTTAPTTSIHTPATTSADRALGILAIVFGIASIALGFQFVFAVAGLVLGILSLRREQVTRGLAITGIITSSVTLAGSLFGAAIALAVFPFIALAALWS